MKQTQPAQARRRPAPAAALPRPGRRRGARRRVRPPTRLATRRRWDELKQSGRRPAGDPATAGRPARRRRGRHACAQPAALRNPVLRSATSRALTQSLRLAGRLDLAASAYAVAAASAATSSPRSISPANTICAWWSRAAATAIRAPPTRRTRCWSGPGAMNEIDAARRLRPRRAARVAAGPRGHAAGPAPCGCDAYDAVTTRAGRYVQGGGCTTVGVAGLVQSGGFGSFSKGFGTAAANLLEAEVVTADGERAHRQCPPGPGPVLGAQGRRRRQLRRRHPADPAHPRSAGDLRLRRRDDPGQVGRGLPAPDRPASWASTPSACSTRTGASSAHSIRQPARNLHGRPGPDPGRGRRPPGSRSSTG